MKPILQALLLADHVYQDAKTGKMIIAGTFNRLVTLDSGKKPAEAARENDVKKISVSEVQQAGSPYAYFSVTEIRDKTDLELRYVDLESQEVLFCISPITIKADTPLVEIEAVVPIPKLPPRQGVYALEILWQDELLGSHRVVVEKIQKPE